MRLTDLEPGDLFVLDDDDHQDRYQVLAHSVELTGPNNSLPEGLLEGLGVRAALGNGNVDLRPSQPSRWGRKGMLACRVSWSTDQRSGGLALFPTGHNLVPERAFLSKWSGMARRSFEYQSKHGTERIEDSRVETKFLVASNTEPTSERLVGVSRMPYGEPMLLVEGHVYPVYEGHLTLDEVDQLGDPERTFRRVMVEDSQGSVYAVDPRHLVFDPLNVEWENIERRRRDQATHIDRARLSSALRNLANQHDTADSRRVSVTNESVTMPIEVLEMLLLGSEEWATAELLDNIMILKDVLEEAS